MKRSPRVVVVGGGLGGLSAAIHAAQLGGEVVVLESQSRLGGKAGSIQLGDVEVDTGPSMLTMPDVFQQLWRLGPDDAALPLRQDGGNFLYRFPDGTSVPLAHRLDESLEHVEEKLGPQSREEFQGFVDYAKEIWMRAAPYFVYGPAPTLAGVAKLGLSGLWDLGRIDPMRKMWSAICAKVGHPKLRSILARYATYNGSNVLTAPATLNCIAYVELGLGGFGVTGGIRALIRSLARVARHHGVHIHTGTPVTGLVMRDNRVVGVRTDDDSVDADAVVANCDAALVRRWLPENGRTASSVEPSMSGWNAIIKARRLPDRPAHQVLFPEIYLEEFKDIFERDRPPKDPTVYVCAPEKAHGTPGWEDHEPLFVMANAPAEPASGPRPPEVFQELEQTILSKLAKADLIGAGDEVVWRRTPTELAALYPESRGSIYGSSSNGMMAAFQRPSNRVHGIRGLYLASGSAHPGGGMPLAALSGRQAVRCLEKDLGRSLAI